MSHHEPDVWIGVGQSLKVKLVVWRLEQPQVGRLAIAEQLHHPTVVLVGLGQVGSTPPSPIAGHRQGHLLAVERHSQDFGVLHGGVDLDDVHGLLLGGSSLVHENERLPAGVIHLLPGNGRRYRPGLLPASEAAEPGVEREHVGQRRRSGAREAVDVDRTADDDVVVLSVLRVPTLDLEAVDQSAPQVTDHGDVRRRGEVAIAFEAVKQHGESFAKVAGAEVAESGLDGGLLQKLISGRVAPHRTRPGK